MSPLLLRVRIFFVTSRPSSNFFFVLMVKVPRPLLVRKIRQRAALAASAGAAALTPAADAAPSSAASGESPEVVKSSPKRQRKTSNT